MPADFHWDDRNVADLRALYTKGVSASQIAVAIGCPTKNAVIGKIHRLGINRFRSKPSRKAKHPKPARAAAPVAKPKPVSPGPYRRMPAAEGMVYSEGVRQMGMEIIAAFDRAAAVTGKGVLFLERSHFQCAMPAPGWDDAPVTDKRVCGQPVQGNTSWCPKCLARVSASPSLAEMKDRFMLKGVAA